ncbi:MAG TPA: YihY/virulence factor BrkB family protein [Candidatus Methylomirabilis sp.]|nr:YihY/virulence factor BrkB family protein [Candidatus Methylomirabilis sp.]
MHLLDILTARAHELLWRQELGALSPLRRRLMLTLRMLYAIVRDILEGDLTLRAMSLVYTTLLSLVPLLALSFSVLKAFGVQNQLRPRLLAFLEPLGDKGVEIANQVIGFVNNIRVGVLGALGLGMLIYTVVALMQKIELAFNRVWRVKRPRPLAQRFSQYLTVLMIGPVLIFSAMGITAALFNSAAVKALLQIELLGSVVEFIAELVPYLLVIAAFGFMYVLVPNTRVRLGSALVGATVAGTLWQTLGWGFAAFVAGSSQYAAIYAGFAIMILSMIWVYLNWLIVLVGASLAFYFQYPAQLASPGRETLLSNRVKEKLALLIATFIGQSYYGNAPAWSLDALVDRVGVPHSEVETLLGAMMRAGIVTETADDPPRYLPAHAFETITVKTLLDAVRTAEEAPGLRVEALPRETEVDELIARADEAVDDSLHGRTLRELALSAEPARQAARASAG